jgi:hypothetical protein
VYSFISDNIESYLKEENNRFNPLAGLIKLLYIIENVNVDNNSDKFGVYRIKNCDVNTKEFIGHIIGSFIDKISLLDANVSDIENKKRFIQQIEQLPSVALSSVLPSMHPLYVNPKNNQYLRLFTKQNFDIPSLDELSKTQNDFIIKSAESHNTSSNASELRNIDIYKLNNDIQAYFNDDNLYIISAKMDKRLRVVNAKLYDIDFNTVDVTANNIVFEPVNNYLSSILVNDIPLFINDLFKNVDYDSALNIPEIVIITLLLFRNTLS